MVTMEAPPTGQRGTLEHKTVRGEKSPKFCKFTYECQIRTTCRLLCWQHALNISKLFANNCDTHIVYNGGTSDRPTRYVLIQHI